ncbi:type III-B CRISPR module-associated protein Cmr5 [Marinomonas mediterranea MMB-1]|nr:type III-B CRISPR module-associated protein Cmr5 [Marinomonas mediterranea MMB-1]
MSVRQHKIAEAAYDCVNKRIEEGIDQKKYAALANKLPNLILQNGLAQATGFLMAKNESTNEHKKLLNDLAFVVNSGHLENQNTPNSDNGKELHQQIIQSDMTKFMQLTQQSLDASGALRRYVQGLMDTNKKDDDSQEETL